jgi:FkbM family methyltransferase
MIILKTYAFLHELFHEKIGFNLPGLGWLYRKTIKDDLILDFNKSKKIFINHKIADNYGRQINGRFNEPETHILMDKAINLVNNFQFIDIGANIGEFILDYADNPKKVAIHAFEPQKEQFFALQNLIKINNFQNVFINFKAVANKIGKMHFNIEANNTSNSGLIQNHSKGIEVEVTTIDSLNLDYTIPTIILIDIEGAELMAMQGGENFIKQNLPLIIFEYNHISKKHFTKEQVKSQLGTNYQIFRLNSKGNLDNTFEKTWNLVAVPLKSEFEKLINEK